MEAALIKRLEDAVQRLERLGVQSTSAPATAAGPARAVTPPPTSPSPTPGSARAASPAPAASATTIADALADFDDILHSKLPELARLSESLAQEAKDALSCYTQGLQETRAVLEKAATTQNPGPSGLQSFLSPVAQHMMALGKLADGKRTAAFNYIKSLCEAMQSFSWLAYTGPDCGLPPPPKFVADTWQSAEFYANKLRMESRAAGAPPGASEAAIAWVKALKDVHTALSDAVARHYPTGIKWNTGGTGAPAAKPAAPPPAPPAPAAPAAPAPPAKKAGGPPPPPPPGPPPKPLAVTSLQDSAGGQSAGGGEPGGGMSALFQELQKGTDITKGLRKVTDDMKTKNRTDRSGFVSIPVKDKAPADGPGGATAAGGAGAKPAAPPRCEYDGERKKWIVENQVKNRELVLDSVDSKQGIYIYNCKDCVIHVTSKANAISIDNCVKTGIMFADVICQVEVINSRALQLQCTGYVPTVSVEKTDGVQIYINKAVTQHDDFQVVTAKCSEVNVHVLPPPEQTEDEPREHPVPEQFISTFNKEGQLITTAAAHSGA